MRSSRGEGAGGRGQRAGGAGEAGGAGGEKSVLGQGGEFFTQHSALAKRPATANSTHYYVRKR